MWKWYYLYFWSEICCHLPQFHINKNFFCGTSCLVNCCRLNCFKIKASYLSGCRVLAFQGLVTLLVTWPFDSLCTVTCRCCFGIDTLSERIFSKDFEMLTSLAVKNSVIRPAFSVPKVVRMSHARPVFLHRKGAEERSGGWMCPISTTGSRSLRC